MARMEAPDVSRDGNNDSRNQGQGRAEMTVRTRAASREDQEETTRMEADVSVAAIMTPEIRARDAEMTVRTSTRSSREDQEREDSQNGGGRFRDGNNDSRNQGQGRRNDGQRPSGGRNQEAVWAAVPQ